MFKIRGVTLLILQSPGVAMELSSHGSGEHFVSSALVSGHVLVALEKAPFHSLRKSLILLMLLTGVHSAGSWSGGCPGGSPQTLPRLGPDILGPVCALQADKT